jgi:hypothetical protein
MMAKELSTSAASIRSAVSIVQAASQQIQIADGNMRGAIAAIHATVALAKQLPSLPPPLVTAASPAGAGTAATAAGGTQPLRREGS